MPLLTGGRNRAEMELASRAAARIEDIVLEQPERRGGPGWGRGGALFPRCANAGCSNGWLRLWRNRSAPVFESGWCCSAECTRVQIEAALWRELGARAAAAEVHRHRIPLGLLMLEKGWIQADDLRRAVEAQRRAGCGRLGEWLIRSGATNDARLTRALALQWSCPVLGVESHDPEGMAGLVPRLFVDALGMLPLRVAAQQILYLGFEDRPDPVLSVVLERMTGLRVESGVVESMQFQMAHAQALRARYAPVELLEAASETALARALAAAIEKTQPVESRLARVHDFLWLRMWTRPQAWAVPRPEEVRDLICALGSGLRAA